MWKKVTVEHTQPRRQLPAWASRLGSEELTASTMPPSCPPSLVIVHQGSQTAVRIGPSDLKSVGKTFIVIMVAEPKNSWKPEYHQNWDLEAELLTNLWQIHRPHGGLHRSNDTRHRVGDLLGCDCCLDSGCHGVDASAHAAVTHGLVLLSDCVLSVDLRLLHVSLLNCLKMQLKLANSVFFYWIR